MFQSLTLATLLFALTSPQSYANGTQLNLSPIAISNLNNAAKNVSNLTKEQLLRLMKIKNGKGQRLFQPKSLDSPDQWSTLDPATGSQGTNTEPVYDQYKDQIDKNAGGDIVVAVIDSGVDIEHEALQGHIWTNPDVEKDQKKWPGDLHGWNFLGGRIAKLDANKKPTLDQNGNPEYDNVDVTASTLEVTREFARLTAKQANLLNQEKDLSSEEALYFARVSADYTAQKDSALYEQEEYSKILVLLQNLEDAGLSKTAPITDDSLAAIQITDPAFTTSINNAKTSMKRVVDFYSGYHVETTPDSLNKAYTTAGTKLDYNLNADYNPYATIVQDHPNLLNETAYGNNDVTGSDGPSGPSSEHATHVSGIIAALRGHGFKVNGQATNVKIMSVRAVPDGDERDKDIGNAIRFAVDHQAKVINMSFGKSYSPQKWYVDQAIAYAEAHGVLMIHAAGNDNKDTSKQDVASQHQNENYPNPKLSKRQSDFDFTHPSYRKAENWIEVGASSKYRVTTLLGKTQQNLVASFSNYGDNDKGVTNNLVDLFAPGVDIISSIPSTPTHAQVDGENQYTNLDGTSMASPEVAGVAALLWNLFPKATMAQIREAIASKETTTQYPNLKVALPGTFGDPTVAPDPTMIDFSELSRTGGVVNASLAAVKLEKLLADQK